MYVCVYVYVYICVCVSVYIYVYICFIIIPVFTHLSKGHIEIPGAQITQGLVGHNKDFNFCSKGEEKPLKCFEPRSNKEFLL